MKKTVTLTLASTLVLGLMAGCATTQSGSQSAGAADTSLADATKHHRGDHGNGNFSDEMKIPYAVDLSPEDGADSVERQGDHADSIYFAHPDFYNMESTDTPHHPHQFPDHPADQRVELRRDQRAHGAQLVRPAGGLERGVSGRPAPTPWTAPSWRGIPGTTLVQLLDILDGVGGFTYTSTLDCQDVYSEFTLDTIQSTLAEGKPILIAWNGLGRTLAGDHRLRHPGHRDHPGRT